MFSGSLLGLYALIYLSVLFVIAHVGDKHGARFLQGRARPYIYALALGVYCTSWTFLGSVGLASRSGFDFLTIYLGPIFIFGFCSFFVSRIVRVAKTHNISSIADFMAARYGKSEKIAAVVTIIAVVGVLPYIALQLKAISASLTVVHTLTGGNATFDGTTIDSMAFGDFAFYIALVLAGFAIAFGTRRIDTTEHHDGLMLAIAVESVVKLVAFLIVGLFVTYGMFNGFDDLFTRAMENREIRSVLNSSSHFSSLFTMTLISAFAVLLLPRQFHVAITENRNISDVRRASWLFPGYLVLINLFVIPIAIAGLIHFPPGVIDRDMTVLALPVKGGSALVTMMALIGGLSAATAMVIVESVALSIMISNDLVMPFLISGRGNSGGPRNMGRIVLLIRRIAIVIVLTLGYIYFRLSSDTALASIGLLSFSAIAQIAPAFLGGMFWRRATSRGAMAGLLIGISVWAYTILLPGLAGPDFNAQGEGLKALLKYGPLGISSLRPTALFGVELSVLAHGVLFSLALNVIAFVAFSLQRPATAIERLQANLFVAPDGRSIAQNLRMWRSTVTIDELRLAVSRYLGEERTNKAFEGFRRSQQMIEPELAPAGNHLLSGDSEADAKTLRFAEHLLASAIGAASSRLVLSLMLRRRNVSTKAALKLLDDASAAIQYNRDILQHALDHSPQGVAVYDRDLKLLACNQAFQRLFDLPDEIIRPGTGLDEIIGFNMARGIYGPVNPKEYIALRLDRFLIAAEPLRLRIHPSHKVIEFRSNRLPDGGVVATYTDVTDTVRAEEALAQYNETLENRVRERTEELTRVNRELEDAKHVADRANLSKTRFLAAASHDILQPLNAARLYASSLVEKADGTQSAELAGNVDASLDAVEDILTTLLDISRLDSGALKPELSDFLVEDLFRALRLEFEPSAKARNLKLQFIHCSLAIRSDRILLRRLLQNLISNAIKYTPQGRVLVGCRRGGKQISIEVVDTGMGIPKAKQKLIFLEFQRLEAGSKAARGLGLGLSIVERIGKVLDHPISIRSKPGAGSTFAVALPISRQALPQRNVASLPIAQAAAISGLRILAIDNEPAILDGLSRLLSGWGCNIQTAQDLKAASKIVGDGFQADVLIADYHLDQATGIDAIEALRRKCKSPLPAILVTADRSPEVREMARLLQIEVLHKPLKPGALRALLGQWQRMLVAAE